MVRQTPDDLVKHARRVMKPFVERLAEEPEVQAVCILSSSADSQRNTTCFDHQSDFDVSVVVDVPMAVSEWRPHAWETYEILADRIPRWMPNFLFHVPVPWGAMEINVHQLVFQYERDARTRWDGQKSDTYSRKCELVHDRQGQFERLIRDKACASRAALRFERERLTNRLTWDIPEMPRRQAERLGAAAGHHVLNVAIDELIDCLYVRQDEFVPNTKWKLGHLQERSVVTNEQHALLVEALRCEPRSLEDLERRIDTLTRLCRSLDGIGLRGSAASECRRRYQARLELQKETPADRISRSVDPELRETVRNIANFYLCESADDVTSVVGTDSLLDGWRQHASRIEAQLREVERMSEALSWP